MLGQEKGVLIVADEGGRARRKLVERMGDGELLSCRLVDEASMMLVAFVLCCVFGCMCVLKLLTRPLFAVTTWFFRVVPVTVGCYPCVVAPGANIITLELYFGSLVFPTPCTALVCLARLLPAATV